MMEIAAFLQNFADMLDDTNVTSIVEDVAFRDLEEWDSLTALSLIAMVDDEYSVKLTGDDIKSSITIKDLYDKVSSKL